MSYDRDSISRAFAHHELNGAIRSYSPPIAGARPKWLVTLPAGAPESRLELNNREAWVLCQGLAAAERRSSELSLRWTSLGAIPQIRDALVKLDPDYILERFEDTNVQLYVDAVKLAVGAEPEAADE